ncbi:olfactory receptor 14C36-like [Elgaria multicarinata webbii]|uniref:olfactory receptor 14C36-like n=1 Tax=Elgaria multicarinata webbii TaxID=159646 RepID=UPI002FCD2AA8
MIKTQVDDSSFLLPSTAKPQRLFSSKEMVNQTSVADFVLLGFSDIRELQVFHFVVFLSIYLVALIGNFLIITTILQHHHLHTPMYFFLVNLSVVDIGYISTTVPKSMANSLLDTKLISYSGCVTQVFLANTFGFSELSLLTVMAYDRYVAICYPLQYRLIMNWKVCVKMTTASLLCSAINGVVQAASIFSLHFCSSHVIEHFFCDFSLLLKISCSDTQPIIWYIFALVLIVACPCFLLVLISYVFIFSTVFKIQSAQGRRKAFSTCTPHLTVFSLFLTTAVFSYMRPKSLSSLPLNLSASILYTVCPPLMNPIIYSLRNREIQVALSKTLNKRI